MWKDFLHLFFPQQCAACSAVLLHHEELICNSCYAHLPKTAFHLVRGNEAESVFFGRVSVSAVGSYYYFNRGSKVQELLHKIKYEQLPEAAALVGEWYGLELKKVTEFSSADYILPVPLHPKKLKVRGYNQSLFFAKGLNKTMGIPVNETLLIRTIYADTQTKKDKFSRTESVENVFEFRSVESLRGKHFLVVDDVLTTGATLESCANSILKAARKSRISFATLAYAQH